MKSSSVSSAACVSIAILAAACADDVPLCPAEEDRFVPMTAAMALMEPPDDTGGGESYVLCPDAVWYPVYDRGGELEHGGEDQDFEVTWADERWVAGVEGEFCFSWLEFHAWALRTSYDVQFASTESGAFGEIGISADAFGIIACDG